MHILSRFLLITILTLVGTATETSAVADTVRFGDGVHGHRIVVGIIGCGVHDSDGLVVVFFQTPNSDIVTAASATSNPADIIGMSCAKALIKLQRRGLRLGQLVTTTALTPVSDSTDSPECLIWEVTD